MRKTSQIKNGLGIALLLGGLVAGFPAVGVAEARELPFLNRDVVLLDCVENANIFVVKNISSTRNVGINQGLDCAAAIQKLLATGFVLGQGAGGVTSGEPTSLNHFLMLFVFNSNALIEPTLERTEPLGPILNRNEPLTPIFTNPEPLTPILQRRNP